MKCSKCARAMVQLFLTTACDYCDYGVSEDKLHKGYIVFRGEACLEDNFEEYVFRTRIDAERWRVAAGREGCEIRTVLSLNPYRWHLSRGTLRDVVLADHMHVIYPDHRFEDLPHRAFITQEEDKK